MRYQKSVDYVLLRIVFGLCAPRKILEATQFQQRYHRYEEIDNVPDKLRWCRCTKGLLQAEVARKNGVSTNVYKNMEDGITQQIPKEVADKLAQLYGVPATDFLDAYNRFLYIGQAQCIREYRAKMGLGKKNFERAMGIPIRSLQSWESGRKVMSRQSWEKYFNSWLAVLPTPRFVTTLNAICSKSLPPQYAFQVIDDQSDCPIGGILMFFRDRKYGKAN